MTSQGRETSSSFHVHSVLGGLYGSYSLHLAALENTVIMANAYHTLTTHLTSTFSEPVPSTATEPYPGWHSRRGRGHSPRGAEHWSPTRGGAQGALSLRKSTWSLVRHIHRAGLGPGSWLNLRTQLSSCWCEETTDGHQPDSHFFQTLSFLWPQQHRELCSSADPAFADRLRSRWQRISPNPHLADSGGTEEVTSSSAKPTPCRSRCCWERNTRLKLLVVWELKTLFNPTGYSASLSGQSMEKRNHVQPLFIKQSGKTLWGYPRTSAQWASSSLFSPEGLDTSLFLSLRKEQVWSGYL